MKIWYGYGSEHSANLVMIGRFKEISDAEDAKQAIDLLVEQVMKDEEEGLLNIDEKNERYTEGMLKLIDTIRIYSIGPSELEQFNYNVNVDIKGNEVIITTEEIEISAFLKVLFDKGARVEVYSGHEYPDSQYGRGK